MAIFRQGTTDDHSYDVTPSKASDSDYLVTNVSPSFTLFIILLCACLIVVGAAYLLYFKDTGSLISTLLYFLSTEEIS